MPVLGELHRINVKGMRQAVIHILLNEEATSSPASLTGMLINHTNAQINVACPNKVLPERKC